MEDEAGGNSSRQLYVRSAYLVHSHLLEEDASVYVPSLVALAETARASARVMFDADARRAEEEAADDFGFSRKPMGKPKGASSKDASSFARGRAWGRNVWTIRAADEASLEGDEAYGQDAEEEDSAAGAGSQGPPRKPLSMSAAAVRQRAARKQKKQSASASAAPAAAAASRTSASAAGAFEAASAAVGRRGAPKKDGSASSVARMWPDTSMKNLVWAAVVVVRVIERVQARKSSGDGSDETTGALYDNDDELIPEALQCIVEEHFRTGPRLQLHEWVIQLIRALRRLATEEETFTSDVGMSTIVETKTVLVALGSKTGTKVEATETDIKQKLNDWKNKVSVCSLPAASLRYYTLQLSYHAASHAGVLARKEFRNWRRARG